MDGVRLNQPFGDVVSWDLIPRIAIASVTLMPGSNPLFGLNTLGGALSVQTKDGRSSAGTTIQAIYGSHVRRAIEFEHGGANGDGLNWYLAGNLFGERRVARRLAFRRPSALRQARLARREDRSRACSCVRQQLADRQRPAGPAPARQRLRERLHEARHDRQPRRTFVNCDGAARASAARVTLVGQRLLSRHPHEYR